jgi:complexin-1/2
MEEKRKEKHRKMEMEREKMRSDIRNKYSLHKKVCSRNSIQYPKNRSLQDESANNSMAFGFDDGRLGSARKKTPEELAAEMQENEGTIIGQLGLTEQVETAKKVTNINYYIYA